MAAITPAGNEGHGLLYTVYKAGTKVKTQGTTKVLSTTTANDLANYVVEQFYDGDTSQTRRADLIQAIALACGLFKGGI